MIVDVRPSPSGSFDLASITRPDRALLTYYILVSLLTTVAFPFVFLPLYFKYHTLEYRLDDEGVFMSWGILFRKQIYLTYRRIQDIHVTRNIFHRWFGLAAVSVQTASGTSGAEMTIEGVRQPELLRDFLYSRMRGVRGEEPGEPRAEAVEAPEDEALNLLREIRDALRKLGKQGETGS